MNTLLIREFVCDRIGEAMENPSLVRSFARALEARGAGLGRRVLMAVMDFLERVREFFTRGTGNPYVRKYDALSREVGRILAGMEMAGGAIGEAAGARRHSVGTRNDGRKYVKVDIDQHIFDGLSPRECLHLARKVILDRFRGKIIGDSPDNAYVNRDSAEEYAHPAARRKMTDEISEAKGRASTELDELMKAATFLDHTEDDGRHQDAKGGWDHYSVEFELSPGNVFRGKISVKITDKGRVFHDMTQIEKVPVSVSGSNDHMHNRNLGDNIAPERRLSVSPAQDAEYMEAVKNGDMEKARKMLIDAASEKGIVLDDGRMMYYRSGKLMYDDSGDVEDSFEIELVETPLEDRGQGIARKLLAAAFQKASDEGLSATGYAYAQDDDTDQERLVDFYERIGFSVDEYDMVEASGDTLETGEYPEPLEVGKKDDSGNVIPLSQRFDKDREDVMYSITSSENFRKRFKARNSDPRYSIVDAVPSKEGYSVERINLECGEQLNQARGAVCRENAVYSPAEVPAESPQRWLREKCLEYARANSLLGRHPCPCLGGDVNLTTGSVKSVLNHAGSDIKNNLISAIPEMLGNAVLVQTETNGNSRTHILVAKVRYGQNERYVCGMVVHENDGEYYYDHELVEIENADSRSLRAYNLPGGRKSASVLNVIRDALSASGFDGNGAGNTSFSVTDAENADYSPTPDGQPPRLISAYYSPLQQEQIVKILKPVADSSMAEDAAGLSNPPRSVAASYSPVQIEQIVRMLKPVVDKSMGGDPAAIREYLVYFSSGRSSCLRFSSSGI